MDPIAQLAFSCIGGKPRPTKVGYSKTEGSANATSLVISTPTGTADGDLMVAFLFAGGGSNNVGSWTNANWTFAMANTTIPNLAVAYRIASSEGASTTFTAGASCKLGGIIRTYRNARFGVIGTLATGTNTTVTASSITVVDNNSVFVGLFANNSQNVTWTNNTGMTFLDELVNDSFSHSWYITEADVDAGATGSKSVSSSVSAAFQTTLVSISPA